MLFRSRSGIGASAGDTGLLLDSGSSEAIDDDRLSAGRMFGVAGAVTDSSGLWPLTVLDPLTEAARW